MVKTNIVKVALVQLYSDLQPPNAEPFAIEVLAGAIEYYCTNCIVNFYTINPQIPNNGIEIFINEVAKSDYEIIGISIPQGTFQLSWQLLKSFNANYRNRSLPLIILGHAIPTYKPEIFLNEFPWVIVARGWGEDCFVDIIRRIQENNMADLESIPGIAFVRNSNVFYTKINNTLIPKPAKRWNIHNYFARVETSRGCHYGRCTFCTRPPGKKDYWIRFPISDIYASIKQLKTDGISYFTFTDEDFVGNDIDGALEIAEMISEIGEIYFSLSVRADNIYNPQGSIQENLKRKLLFKNLKQSGLVKVFIGLESMSNSQLLRYGKGVVVDDCIKAVNIIKSFNIPIEVGFIMFDPFIKLSEINESVRALKISGIWEYVGALFSKLRVQVMTPYELWLKKKNLLREIDINTLSCTWHFEEKDVEEIADICLAWYEPFEQIYLLIRNLERTKKNNEFVKEFITKFRWLDLIFIENCISLKSEATALREVPYNLDHFYTYRQEILLQFYKNFKDMTQNNNEEIILLDKINQFFTQRVKPLNNV